MRLAELRSLAPQIHLLISRYGATNLVVFGSVARDEASDHSDVDLLVDLPDQTSLIARADLKLGLEKRLQKTVDPIRRRNL